MGWPIRACGSGGGGVECETLPGLLGDCGGTVGIAGGAALNECLVTRAGFGTLSRGKPQALGALEHGLMLSEDAADDVVSRGRDRDVVEGGIRAEGSIDVAGGVCDSELRVELTHPLNVVCSQTRDGEADGKCMQGGHDCLSVADGFRVKRRHHG